MTSDRFILAILSRLAPIDVAMIIGTTALFLGAAVMIVGAV